MKNNIDALSAVYPLKLPKGLVRPQCGYRQDRNAVMRRVREGKTEFWDVRMPAAPYHLAVLADETQRQSGGGAASEQRAASNRDANRLRGRAGEVQAERCVSSRMAASDLALSAMPGAWLTMKRLSLS